MKAFKNCFKYFYYGCSINSNRGILNIFMLNSFNIENKEVCSINKKKNLLILLSIIFFFLKVKIKTSLYNSLTL